MRLSNFIIIISLTLLSSCYDSSYVRAKRDRSINLMNQSLNLCFDVFVLKQDVMSKEKLKSYQSNKSMAGDIWQEFSYKDEEKYYRDLTVKAEDESKKRLYTILTLGTILFSGKEEYALPPYENYRYENSKKRPNYSGIIRFCDEKTQRLAKFYDFTSKIREENDFAKNLGYPKGIWGYDREIYNLGMIDVILESLNNPNSKDLSMIGKYLIMRGNATFRVQNIINNYVIYSHIGPDSKNYRFALLSDGKSPYLQDSILKGSHFASIGTFKFNEAGANIELMAFKKITN